MDERPVQAKECAEHHKQLKDQLDKINKFLFEDSEHPTEIPMIAKVNIMYHILIEIKRWAIGAVFTFAGCLIFLGSHFERLENIQTNLGKHIEQAEVWHDLHEQRFENHEQRLVRLEEIIKK